MRKLDWIENGKEGSMSEDTGVYQNKRRLPLSDLAGLIKLPPQAIEAEEATIAAMLIEAGSCKTIINDLNPAIFYKHENQKIAQAIVNLNLRNQPIDIITVSSELRAIGELESVGGAYGVSVKCNQVANASNVHAHYGLVLNTYLCREVIRITSEVQAKAYEPGTDSDELINDIQDKFIHLNNQSGYSIAKITTVLNDLYRLIARNQQATTNITGVPTGFTPMDQHTGGLQPGDLIIIAGETSNGKTATAINVAVNAAERGYGVGIFSLEMTNTQNVSRMVASRAMVSGKRILASPLDEDELIRIGNAIGCIENLNIYLDDANCSELTKLVAGIKNMIIKHKVGLIIIDYLQLIRHTAKGMNKADIVAEIANTLKSVARFANVPIILLSQLSRDNQNPKPTLSRLKGSGDIENAADIVWFTYLPEKYGYGEVSINFTSYETKGLAYHTIAKGRNYGLTEFALSWNETYGLLTDYQAKIDLNNNEPIPF